MRGIILAGGSGTRLYPITQVVSKQLMPVYSKPMIYYPLSILMRMGIRDILIITTRESRDQFANLLSDGSQLGIQISYCIQDCPDGLAQAFILGESFIGTSNVCLILGDNIFYGDYLNAKLTTMISNFTSGSCIFGYEMKDPTAYGVVEISSEGNVLSLEEKPKNPKSPYAIPGLYFFDNTVIEKAKRLKPSLRGELEIVDLIQQYVNENKCKVIKLGRGTAWFDTGTPDYLLDASNFIAAIEKRQGEMVACLEEIAYVQKFITKAELTKLAKIQEKSSYGKYLLRKYLLEVSDNSYP